MADIHAALARGTLVPYIGPGVLNLGGRDCTLPASPLALVTRLISGVSVPHKLRTNLTGAAQFIENFKHRKTVVAQMRAAFAAGAEPTRLHRFLASDPGIPLIVHAWYDDLPQRALARRTDWMTVQGASQAEHFGQWTMRYHADGTQAADDTSARTLLYQPLGSIAPAANFLVPDSDFVEVLTEIDIQTPIPDAVQMRRLGGHFLFLGCRFSSQLERIFAHQISKRSSPTHWAVLPEQPTRNEARFMAQHGIQRLDIDLAAFSAHLAGTRHEVAA
jgi:hypothetical protein